MHLRMRDTAPPAPNAMLIIRPGGMRVREISASTAMPGPVDRYPDFRYRVLWSSRVVAGFRAAGGLPQKAKGSAPWKGGSPRPSIGPEGQGTPFFISLWQGVSFDLGFGQWVSMVRCYGPATGRGSLCREYLRPLAIEVYDEHGKFLYAYHLSRCWVTEYRAVPGPDTGSDEIVIEHLKLGFERWERDPPEEG
jgi:phage tail-like protein